MEPHSANGNTVTQNSEESKKLDLKETGSENQEVKGPAQLGEVETCSRSPLEEETVYPGRLKVILITIGLMLAVFLVALDQTIIATAIPRITDRFQSIRDIGWYGSAYFLTGTALQPTFGRVYKTFSIKGTFLTAIGFFELGSLICGVAPNSATLIVGRAIAGIGVGGIFSGCILILAHILPLRKRPLAIACLASVWGIASIIGPLLGGAFTDHVSWRWCFYINLPLGAISVVVVTLVLKLPHKSEGLSLRERIYQLDLVGAAILIPTVVSLLLALQWGGTTYAWDDPKIIGLFVCFGCLVIVFIASQWWLGDAATLPLRILRQRSVLASFIFAYFFGSAFFTYMYYLPIYFQSVKGSSATKSGIQIIPFLLSCILTSVVSGGLITAVGYYTPFLIGGMLLFAIGAGLITTFNIDTHSSPAYWIGYQTLTGFGLGVGFQVPILAVQTVLEIDDVPIGTAVIIFFQTLGAALFVSVAQSIFSNGLKQGLQEFLPEVPPSVFIFSGATEIQKVLADIGKPDRLEDVRRAYMIGLSNVYKLALALVCCAFVTACFLEWKNIKVEEQRKTSKEPGTKENSEAGIK
ncbi:hypothetical protein TWF225_008059 [Orbilia oligospora]|uniref:Uncharacterized protein n=1 Tax=Orbilia oligospora TaxID=2813651 RepID=A0A7C8K5Y2_ORBOL|nr:hypothetical protein TWF751_010571 [Orbilia oligospora]KAF3177782.1 hypothetical protein TWF225_008059 [Orbilia oligospora]KAF3239804.1 hypothetical protein TWF128_011688 [Orbilia oligospora]KAF3248002.1 hypothetical protein TWF217_009460 [Orbilia oligospora]KAF3276256.1 hypothetical protein TWF132_002257 [Orbilia oligospora]